jgi:Putative zinc-finger
MREQHLSDEAIAAFADDVLTGHPRDRARKHTATCPECNYAVVVQREAVWALRSAPAPSLPLGLMDRLRDVPVTTPIRRVPTAIDEHGTAMFATFAAPAAALVPPARQPARPRSRRARPMAITAASFAVVGVLAGSAASADTAPPAQIRTVNVQVPASDQAPARVQVARAVLPGRAW